MGRPRTGRSQKHVRPCLLDGREHTQSRLSGPFPLTPRKGHLQQLTVLGKPKRPRNAFNIFVSEHFQEAKGASIQGKMKNVFEEWQKMTSSQKQTYQQLAEDDKIRYENEMKSWEDHMTEIGREDLVRYKNRRKTSKGKETSKGKKTTKKLTSKKKVTTVKKSSGSKVAVPAIKEKRVKAKKSEE